MRKLGQIRDRFTAQILAGERAGTYDAARDIAGELVDRRAPEPAAALVAAVVAAATTTGATGEALALIDDLLARLAAAAAAAAAADADADAGDPDRIAVARGRLLATRAGVVRGLRRPEEALANQDEAQRLLADTVTDAERATLAHDRAVLLAETGDLNAAVRGLVAARDAFLAVRDRVGVAASDHNLAFVLHDMGAMDDAMEYLNEARDIFLATGMDEEAASCDQNLGVVFYDTGRLADAGRRFVAARSRFLDNDARVSAAECDANLSTVLEAMGHTEEAARHRLRAERSGVGMPTVPGTSTQIRAVPAEVQPAGSSGTASA